MASIKKPTRREFMTVVGATLGAAMVGRCALPGNAVAGTETQPRHEAWGQLREAWFALDELTAKETQTWGFERANAELAKRRELHRKALGDLVAAKEVSQPVADKMQLAFKEAAFHIWRVNSGASCYEPPPLSAEVQMRGRHELMQQLEALKKLAASGKVDTATLEVARETIERDIHVLEALSVSWDEAEKVAPDLDALFGKPTVETSTECLEAATLLVRVLSGAP